MAYLNSDDLLLPGALYAVAAYFEATRTRTWCTGTAS